MAYSQHQELFSNAGLETATFAGNVCLETGYSCVEWLSWFRAHHSQLAAKYQAAEEKINTLWGKSDSKSMGEFQRAIKNWTDAIKLAVEKYVAWRKEQGHPLDYVSELPAEEYKGPKTLAEAIVQGCVTMEITVKEKQFAGCV
ncbi:MAG: hypothetical protein AB1553_01825 [Nitrospirota bacterium]